MNTFSLEVEKMGVAHAGEMYMRFLMPGGYVMSFVVTVMTFHMYIHYNEGGLSNLAAVTRIRNANDRRRQEKINDHIRFHGEPPDDGHGP